MHFSGPFTLEDATEREWLLANGLGGYASSTLCGMSTRRYHGLLVGALHPPGGRTLLVAKLDEAVAIDGKDVGKTPFKLAVPVGAHTVRLTSGGVTREKQVQVKLGADEKVVLNFVVKRPGATKPKPPKGSR